MERALVWLRNAAITVGLIAGQAAVSLRHNWGIGLLSLALAVSFWVYVTDRENPEQSGRVPGSVAIESVNVPPGQAVFSVSPDSVSVRASAPESVFERLTAEDFRATVDLSAMTGQRATVKVRVESEESRAEVVDVSPAEVTVTLEEVTSRTVPVRVRQLGGLPPGFRLGAIEVGIEQAVVTGPERLVRDVAVVQGDVNLTGYTVDFEQRVVLQARVEGGTPIQDVEVEPEIVVVQVEIIQLEFSADFIVRPDVSGSPADGYNVTAIRVDPATVMVTGSLDVLQSIDAVTGIETEAVSIDGAITDVVQTVALRLPQGARVEQPGVTLRVMIAPAQGTFGYSVALRLTNVPSGLTANVAQPTVQVVLAGAVPDLGAVEVGEIEATLDLDGLEAGEHVVPVRVQAPSGTTVESITPASVRITLRPP